MTRMLEWLQADLRLPLTSIEAVTGDASFRRYFRAVADGVSYIVMDAPVDREDVGLFVRVAGLLRGVGLHVPIVHGQDLRHGFLLLDDLGDRCYLDSLTEATAPTLYGDAMEALARLQGGIEVEPCPLRRYDEQRLRDEMDLFRVWFLQGLLGLRLTPSVERLFDALQDVLVASALAQPQVCVHRDFHARNLMVVESNGPGILDFQDALIGPVTYDPVSLLRDCYIAWPQAQVDVWMADCYRRLCDRRVIDAVGLERFCGWFDLMGVQRHLKAVGIFSRLKLRDGRPGYLADIPRTMGYIRQVSERYPILAEFDGFLQDAVLDRVSRMDQGR